MVKAGECVEVTERGELVALLTPPEPARNARQRLLAAGRLLPAVSPSGRLRGSQPVPVVLGAPSNQQLLDAQRAERL